MGVGIEVLRRVAKEPRAYSFQWLAARWMTEMAKLPTRREMRRAGLCDCKACMAELARGAR